MILQLARDKRRRILIDIDTQNDLLLADGMACIRNHRRILGRIRRVMAAARVNNIHVISTALVYPNTGIGRTGEMEPCPEGMDREQHCIDGTWGQKKVGYTLLRNRFAFPAEDCTDLPKDVLRLSQQVILHKRCIDPFSEPRIDRLLSEVKAGEFILIGATAEGAVLATALGLLQRDKKVTVIADAIGASNNRDGKMAFRKMGAKGASLVDAVKLVGASSLRQVGACGCESCRGGAKSSKANPTMPNHALAGMAAI